MFQKPLHRRIQAAREKNQRLVAPLLGLPGLKLVGTSVKIAQQNFGKHFEVLKALHSRFRPDIIFPLMDLTVEANAVGRTTVFPKHDSATVLKDHFEIAELNMQKSVNINFDVRLLGYIETMKLMSIGFPDDVLRGAYVTGPYTMAGQLMGAEEAAMAALNEPDKLDVLCRFTTEKAEEYARQLIAAGSQIICILEPSAVMLGPDQFEQFSARYVRHISDGCRFSDAATVYHICGNSNHLIDKMVESGVDALSLDSREMGVDLPSVAERVKGKVGLVGNISPTETILKSNPDAVEKEVRQLLEAMAPYENFVLSTGCDLPRGTPVQNIEAFMRAGRTAIG
ncbi:MAG: uroporphyrinogen decarboxylase family protein [bacterium]|nr:uroporphyrinogen decarboxylase family protein [bacterium]